MFINYTVAIFLNLLSSLLLQFTFGFLRIITFAIHPFIDIVALPKVFALLSVIVHNAHESSFGSSINSI
jgi:hypothetical protein